MVLPAQVHAPCVGQRAGDRCHCIFQGCWTLLSAYDKSRDGDQPASVTQHRPILQQREVVRERMRDGQVLLPRTPHDERHDGDE